MMTASSNGNGNLIDEFEDAYQQCLSLFINEDGVERIGSGTTDDKDQPRIVAEQVTLRFKDIAMQVESFFLQKRLLLFDAKPELAIKEDIVEVKVEVLRKEEMIRRHHQKIMIWKNLLSEMRRTHKPNEVQASPGDQNGQIQGPNVDNGSAGQQQQQQQQLSQFQMQKQQQQQMNLQQYSGNNKGKKW